MWGRGLTLVSQNLLRMVLQAPASVWCCVSQDPALPSGNMLGRGLGSRVSKALLRMVFGTSRLITEGAWIRADREPNRARARACVNSRDSCEKSFLLSLGVDSREFRDP